MSHEIVNYPQFTNNEYITQNQPPVNPEYRKQIISRTQINNDFPPKTETSIEMLFDKVIQTEMKVIDDVVIMANNDPNFLSRLKTALNVKDDLRLKKCPLSLFILIIFAVVIVLIIAYLSIKGNACH